MSRSWVEIDMAAIRHNAEVLLGCAGGAELCAVVKADGYGHGAIPAARAALAGGASILAVAQVDEGMRLREAGIDARIWVLSEPEPHEFLMASQLDLEPTVYSRAGISAAYLASQETAMTVHLKVDTGMHRVGARAADVVAHASEIDAVNGLTLGSVWTHCALADDPESGFTDVQMDRFELVLKALAERGLTPPLRHAANSGGTIAFARTHFDVVRCGIALYGLGPSEALSTRVSSELGLRPALRWLTRVGFVKRLQAGDRVSYGLAGSVDKPTTVVTLPVGYADGYRRALWQVPETVLIGGKARSIVGVVTMDQIIVDVGDDEVAPGDEAVLIGAQGDSVVSADYLAASLGTINYEIVCGLSARVKRVYINQT